MAADQAKLRYLASKGHFGHSALLDPDQFVSTEAPNLGIQVAQADVNEIGIPDRMKTSIVREPSRDSALGGISPEYDKNMDAADKALEQRLRDSGVSEQEIVAARKGL